MPCGSESRLITSFLGIILAIFSMVVKASISNTDRAQRIILAIFSMVVKEKYIMIIKWYRIVKAIFHMVVKVDSMIKILKRIA